MTTDHHPIRYDLQIIASWIPSGSRVLGLGCGEGELLHFLKHTKGVTETGIEIAESKVSACIEKGLSVIQGDINTELDDYPDASFDCVVLSQTIQQTFDPVTLLKEIMRIGKTAVVSFPNFSHWKVRTQFLFSGHAPKTEVLPYAWYDTPNIRVLSLRDFTHLAREAGFEIINEMAIKTSSADRHGKTIRVLPNLRATYGLFLIRKA
ncbi:methionine biosynthesis protein MetW [Desulfoluna spongiiphila]|uniref:Methionine biosynthesis protein MetW n=1 Tax=Desulfoluna spongiiphila TaxID=419481 RepID=A0A1G5JAY5_9BACT|nr:methionine biosynthesis protein MetW [Desulfoluna spongiiphila]SCY85354.1 methionine biosynthesis protein MetW [Desulfoluna spongiiphila]VVS94200.1 methionine biosynthesis metw [Desulfoluna spongiiphila]